MYVATDGLVASGVLAGGALVGATGLAHVVGVMTYVVYEQLVTAGAAQSCHAEVVATDGLVVVLLEVEAQSAHSVVLLFLVVVEEEVEAQSAHSEVVVVLVVVVVELEDHGSHSSRL